LFAEFVNGEVKFPDPVWETHQFRNRIVNKHGVVRLTVVVYQVSIVKYDRAFVIRMTLATASLFSLKTTED
jgi:hypothetical protein